MPKLNGTRGSKPGIDQCTSGLNYDTMRPRSEILDDYRTVLRTIYPAAAFFERVRRLARELDVSRNRYRTSFRRTARDLRSFARILWQQAVRDGGTRGPLALALLDCILRNPRALRMVVSLAALYLHYGPFARQMEERLAERPRIAVPAIGRAALES